MCKRKICHKKNRPGFAFCAEHLPPEQDAHLITEADWYPGKVIGEIADFIRWIFTAEFPKKT